MTVLEGGPLRDLRDRAERGRRRRETYLAGWRQTAKLAEAERRPCSDGRPVASALRASGGCHQLTETSGELAVVNPGKPCIKEHETQLIGGRQIGGRGWEVSIGGSIAQKPPDQGNSPFKPDLVASQENTVGGSGDLKEADASSWAHDSTHLMERGCEVSEVPQRIAADESIDRTIAQREGRGIRLHERPGPMGRTKHPEREVSTDRYQPLRSGGAAEVTGTAGKVEDPRSSRESE